MILILTIIFFIFGLIIGSFLNVLIYRMNTAKSLGGRSACMSCREKLNWYELIPVISFLALGGRCRSCKTKISLQYPLVELVSGLIFAVLFFKFQNIFFLNTLVFIIAYAYYAVMFSLLLVIAFYDSKHKIIPDKLSLIFGLLALIGLFFFHNYEFYFHIPSTFQFLSGIFIALPFFLLWLLSGGAWMGLGDAKLALGLGWFLGLSLALSALVISFCFGAIIGVCLVVVSASYGMKSEIPFAPYLVLGTFLAFLFQLNLFNIYF